MRAPASGPTPAPAPAPPGRPLGLAALVLLVGGLVAAVHAPVLDSQALALDDHLFVARNPLVQRPGWPSVGRFFGEVLNPSTVSAYYTPLSMTSLMLDVALGDAWRVRPEAPTAT